MKYFNFETLSYVFLIAFLITILAVACKLIKKDSKNATYFLISSASVLITVAFLGSLILILPNTEKTILSQKCMDYETARRNVTQFIPDGESDGSFKVEIMKDDECENPYLEVKTVSTVLTALQIFEVHREEKYVLHMPPKEVKSFKEEALE